MKEAFSNIDLLDCWPWLLSMVIASSVHFRTKWTTNRYRLRQEGKMCTWHEEEKERIKQEWRKKEEEAARRSAAHGRDRQKKKKKKIGLERRKCPGKKKEKGNWVAQCIQWWWYWWWREECLPLLLIIEMPACKWHNYALLLLLTLACDMPGGGGSM